MTDFKARTLVVSPGSGSLSFQSVGGGFLIVAVTTATTEGNHGAGMAAVAWKNAWSIMFGHYTKSLGHVYGLG